MSETMTDSLVRLLKAAGAEIVDVPSLEEPENEVEQKEVD